MFSQSNAQIGEYQIVDHLGAGGMGEVYRAVHSRLGRVAAIKVLNHAVSNPMMIERFGNEARIQASLQHPSIATLYDYCEYNGHPCIVMEFVDGRTLDEVLSTDGILPLPETLRIFTAVVEAVAYIHSHSIVHRDIKANNIKLTATGAVKLLDFGISQSATTPKFTEVGNIIGTWQYLSPEQIYSGTADARSDVWTLGVLLYEMVAGELPFEATTFGGLPEKIKKGSYLTPSILNQAVPKDVESIIAKCLRKHPTERYQTAAELLHDLTQMNDSQLIPAARDKKSSELEARTSWLKQTTKFKPLVLTLSFFIVAWLVSWLMWNGESPNLMPEAPAQLKTIRIRLIEGKAEVLRNGTPLGFTPYEAQAKSNEQLSFVLKRSGYQDLPIQIKISDHETNNEVVYQMRLTETQE